MGLRCFFGMHKLYPVARVGYGTDLVACERCTRRWGMNHNLQAFLPWREVSELYEGPDALFPQETWRPYVRRPKATA